MSFLTQFPYTNLHELNLDWIIKSIKELAKKVDDSVTSKIKIADPLQWDISKQYEPYTIVMDNGNAYLSMQPVPYGISIENTDYWQKIFDVEQVFESLKHAISFNDDGNSTTASQNRSVGDLVWLDDTLKIVTNEISEGGSYTDQNIEDISIELLLNTIQDNINNIADDIAEIQEDLEQNIINRLYGKTVAIYGDSWVTDNWSTPWLNKLATLIHSPTAIHHVGLGSATMNQIYLNCWDGFVADIYIIMGGLNDVSLNTGGDVFMATLNEFSQSMHTANPNAEIYFVTPPKVDRNDFLHARLPLEFYRTCIWRLANKNKYHVINGLKWVDIKFADTVHPSAASAPVIADYLFESMLNFGDEETHNVEVSTIGRQNNQVLLEMNGGIAYLLLQGTVFSPLQSDGSAGVVIDAGINLNQNQTVCFGKGNGSNTKNNHAMIVTGPFGNQIQAVVLCPPLVGTGATSFTLSYSLKMELQIARWYTTFT